MKIPKQLKIAGLDWQVSKNADVAREGRCFGSTHHYTQKINLDPATTQQKREQTFIHETLHACWDLYGLGNVGDLKKFEEQIVDALSNGFYQVGKDNNLFK